MVTYAGADKESGQFSWHGNLQQVAFALCAQGADGADAVHMAAHDVAAQAVVGAQCFFQIHDARRAQPCGALKRLGRNVDREGAGGAVKRGDCHAGAIQGDAVAVFHVIQIARRGL